MQTPRRRIVRNLSCLLALAVIQVALAGSFLSDGQEAAAAARLRRTMNILLIGTDARLKRIKGVLEEPRTDVLMLASCEPGRNRVTILSIPRDTLVEMPGRGTIRINMANVYGGLKMTKMMVENLTGLPVDRYVAVDFRAFAALVDLLGGVEVDVDKRMYYRDRAQNFEVNLEKGRQVLDGREALGFVRYRRDPLGDISRIGRQQRLMQAVAAKAVRERLWLKLIPLYRLKQRYVRTDLSLADLYRLRNFISHLTIGANLRTFTVPGWFSGPYWEADKKALAELVEREFTPPLREPRLFEEVISCTLM